MRLPVFALLALLGLSPVASAAAALVHLCESRQEHTLRTSCCCPSVRKAAQVASQEAGDVWAQASTSHGCCELTAARPLSAPPAMAADLSVSLLLKAPALPAPPSPGLARLFPPEAPAPHRYGRAPGLAHATAPPLFLQLRTLLL